MPSDWVLSLEQHSDAEVTAGTLADTAEAVRRKADLRLFLIARGYEETLYFQHTYAGEHDAFAGLMTHHHSYPQRGSLAEQPYFSFFKYDASAAKQSLASRLTDFVAMAAYDDYGPGYIGTEIAYGRGCYETGRDSRVAPHVEKILLDSMKQLLDVQP